MTFTHPLWLGVAAVFVIACWLAFSVAAGRRSSQALRYSNLQFLAAAAQTSRVPQILVGAGLVAAALLLGMAPSGPHFIATVPAKDGTVILCVDTSGSMAAQDVVPSRSDAAKAAARGFINEVPEGTKIGIVSFSTSAEVVAPPTAEKQTVLDSVERIPLPNGATAIGDALALAARLLPEKGHRVVVLLTDGVNNRGVDPLEVAKFLGSKHVPVYTIGIGSNDSGQVIPGTSEAATIDEDALKSIAAQGGAAYARADTATQLQSALAGLGRTTVMVKKKIDATLPFAYAGGLLLVITFLGALAAGRFP